VPHAALVACPDSVGTTWLAVAGQDGEGGHTGRDGTGRDGEGGHTGRDGRERLVSSSLEKGVLPRSPRRGEGQGNTNRARADWIARDADASCLACAVTQRAGMPRHTSSSAGIIEIFPCEEWRKATDSTRAIGQQYSIARRSRYAEHRHGKSGLASYHTYCCRC
jgi:hypothetical protein